MGKIVFFENANFGGSHYECDVDCPDLHHFLNKCNSIKVEDDCFMIYECCNYMGHQYFVSKGEYPDYQHWRAISDSIRSCRKIPVTEQTCFKMHVFERMEYGGQMIVMIDDCPSLKDRFKINDIFSCKVFGGHWLFYEYPHYQGRMYLMRPGEYQRFSEWGGRSACVGSIKRILDY